MFKLLNKKIIRDWNLLEILLLLANVLIVTILLIYQCCTLDANKHYGYTDWATWVAFICSITNIISVLLAIKKKISCFLWGIVTVIGFGAVAFYNKLFGNMIQYWCLYIPVQAIAIFLWRRHSNDKKTVTPTQIKWWQIPIFVCVTIVLIIGFTYIEIIPQFQKWWFHIDIGNSNTKHYPTWQCSIDASILILSIMMTIFTWMRFRERWLISILVDICQIVLWSTLAITTKKIDTSSIIMIVSSSAMLISAIYGAFNWWKVNNN